jgi:hypothetical protein
VYFHVQLIKWVCCLRCSRGIQSTKAHPAFQGFGLCSQRSQEFSVVKCYWVYLTTHAFTE